MRMLKRLLMGMLVAGLVPFTAWALETTVITGTASWGNPFFYPFTTNRVGYLAARAQFVPKKNTRYWLRLTHLTDSNPDGFDLLCQQGTFSNPQPSEGDFLCEFSDAPAGDWTVEFFPVGGGKVEVTVSITGETD